MSLIQIYYKDGCDDEGISIVTDFVEEGDFLQFLSSILIDAIKKDKLKYIGVREILENAFEICCKLRGYKNNVKEKRVLMAGKFWPSNETPSIEFNGTYADENILYEGEYEKTFYESLEEWLKQNSHDGTEGHQSSYTGDLVRRILSDPDSKKILNKKSNWHKYLKDLKVDEHEIKSFKNLWNIYEKDIKIT